MKTKAKKVLLSLISLALTGAMGATIVLTEPSKQKAAATTTVRGSGDAIDVTEQYRDQLSTEQFINKDLAVNAQTLNVKSDGTRRIIVEFESDSLLDTYLGDTWLQTTFKDFTSYINAASGKQYASALEKEQVSFFKALDKKAFDYQLRHTYTSLLNAVSLVVDDEDVAKVEKMSGVKRVVYSETYDVPSVEATTNVVDVYSTGIYNSSSVNYKGEGMLVAVLDTGFDRSHNAFQEMPSVQKISLSDVESVFDTLEAATYGEEVTAEELYYNPKVPFAYDYADGDGDVFPKSSQHGVHVAGIIAGKDNTVTASDGEAFENGEKFLGVAPNAQLMIGKVFSDKDDGTDSGAETDDLLAALSDCVAVGADVINMSLGSSCGFSREEDNSAVNAVYDKIYAAGINLVVAASNDYSAALNGAYGSTNLTSNPDSSTVGSPSTYVGALSVASISGQKSPYMELDDGTAVYYNESSNAASVKGDFMEELLKGAEEKTFNYVVIPGYGEAQNYAIESVKTELAKGNCIAVVSRGDISFEDKQKNAFDNGAVGCIIYNNASGKISASLGTGKKVPTCTVSADIGQIFIANEKGTITLNKNNKAGPFMSDFSSWGPTNDLKIKPEITAHGGEITSSVVGGYSIFSGTSMASPNMAGAVTLLRQYVSENFGLTGTALSDRVNQLLMSTATIVYDENGLPYSVRKQGAGLGDISKASSTDAYIYVQNNSKPKLELGDDPKRTGVYTMEFHVSNTSSKTKTYSMDLLTMTESVSIDGITVAEKAYMLDNAQKSFRVNGKASGKTLTLAAGADATISVTLSLSAQDKEYLDKNFKNGMYVEGFVTLTDKDSAGVDLSLPYLAFYGDWTDAPIFDKSAYEVSESKHDTSIPDEEKTIAAIYESVAIGKYGKNNVDFYLPLGQYIYTVDENESDSGVLSSVDKISVGNYEYGIYEFYAMYFGLLRGAKEMTVEVKNTVTGEIIKSETLNNVRKSHGSTPSFTTLEMSPYQLGLQNNTQYSLVFEAKLDYDNGKTKTEKQEFSFYVDYQSPIIYESQFRYEYDSEDNRHVYLDLYLYDNHYVQSVQLFTLPDKDTLDYLTDYPIPVKDGTRGGIVKVTQEITDWMDNFANAYGEYKNHVGVRVDDYALNGAAYVVPIKTTEVDSIGINYTYRTEAGEDVTKSVADGQILLQPGQELNLTDDFGKVITTEGETVDADFSVNLLGYATYTCNHVDEHGATCGYIYNERKGLTYQKGEYYYDAATQTVKQKTATEEDAAYPPYTLFTDMIAEPITDKKAPASKHFVCPHCGTEVTFTYNTRTNKIVPTTYDKTSQDPMVEDYKWSTSNQKVVMVEDGKLYAVAVGSATVTVYAEAGNTTFSFMVKVQGDKIDKKITKMSVGSYDDVTRGISRELSGTLLSIDCGTILDLYPKFPWYVSNVNDLQWTSQDSEIAEITSSSNASARVVCKKQGVVSIYLRSKSNTLNATLTLNIGIEYKLTSYYFHEYHGVGYSETYIDKYTENPTFDSRNILVIPANLGIVNMGYITTSRNGPFYQNKNLDTVVVPQGVTTLGINCFADSTLRRIYLPSSLEAIAYNAFSNCPNLQEVYWYDADEKSDSGIVYDADENTYNWDKFYANASAKCSAKNLVVGSNAFNSCAKLTTFDFSKVTALYTGAFSGCKLLTSADLTRLRYANADVFSNCTSLKEVSLSEHTTLNANIFSGTGIEKIDYYASSVPASAFAGTRSLQEVVFHNDLQSVGEKAFYNCIALKKVTFEGSCVSIGASAFENCRALSEFTVPEGAELLGARAFANCKNLVTVYVDPESDIQDVGADVFAGSNALKKIEIAGSGSSDRYNTVSYDNGVHKMLTDGKGTRVILVPPTYQLETGEDDIFYVPDSFSANGEKVTAIGAQAYANNASLKGKEVVIPEGITSIGLGAFQGSGITKVVIPSTVKSIAAYAFAGCSNLETVVFLGDIEMIADHLFNGCTSLKYIQLPDSVKSIGDYAFAGSGLASVEIGANVESIGVASFDSCENLTSLTFVSQTKLSSIGEGAFRYCSALKSLSMADSIKDIGAYAFADCSSLTDLYVSAGVEKMGAYVFSNDLLLVNVEFGKGAKVVGDYAFCTPYGEEGFYNQKNLKNVKIPSTVESIGFYAFAGNIALTEIDLSGVKSINGAAFFGTSALKSVKLNGSMEYIGAGAFLNSAVENIDLSGVEYFDSQCFSGTNVIAGEFTDALVIGANAFYNCRNIKEVNLPNAEYIYSSAFFAPTKVNNAESTGTIRKVTFGEKLKGLGGGAFFNSVITSIRLPASLETIGAPAFAGCFELGNIEVDAKNPVFFCDDLTGALYKHLDNGTYELVAVPNGIHMESIGEEMTPFQILDNTSRIGSWAMGYCEYIHAVEIPASVKSIGTYGFYYMGMGILMDNDSSDYDVADRILYPKYIFKGLEAPTLETDYDDESTSPIDLYMNFSYPIGYLMNDMIIPVNSKGFENTLYTLFFKTQTYTDELIESDTQALLDWLADLDVEKLTLADANTVTTMNLVFSMLKDSQKEFISEANQAKLAQAVAKIESLREEEGDSNSSDSGSSSETSSSDTTSEENSSSEGTSSESSSSKGCGSSLMIGGVATLAALSALSILAVRKNRKNDRDGKEN